MRQTIYFTDIFRQSIKKSFCQLSIFVLLLTYSLPSLADTPDIVMQALQDEMTRSMQRLKLSEHAGPYFIFYTISEYDSNYEWKINR